MVIGSPGHRYDAGRAALPTFLYGVARNLLRARLRSERRLESLDALDAERPELVRDDAALERLAGARDAEMLRVALAALPSRYRELIILCDLHGLSYESAAEVVGASVPAVRSRLHRGRARLRATLTPAGALSLISTAPARCTP